MLNAIKRLFGPAPHPTSPSGEFMSLLFADQGPEQTPGPGRDPEISAAWKQASTGQRSEALAALLRVAEGRREDSRRALWAARAIVHLGETPPSLDPAGVVVEARLKGGVDIIAAYADHAARYVNFSGKIIVWEPHSDAQINGIIDTAMNAARALVPHAKPRPRTPFSGAFRATVLLTTGNADLTEQEALQSPSATAATHAISAPMQALVVALIDRTMAQGKPN